jgi:RNA polymerase-binding protein DksA
VAKQAPKKSPIAAEKPAKKAGKSAASAAAASEKFAKKPAAAKAQAKTPAPVASAKKPAATVAMPSRRGVTAAPAVEPARPAAAVPVPVPTNGKPRKNQAGLSAKELEHFRDLLLQKRRELVGDMGQMEREALRSASGSNLSNLPLHMADMGTDNYEQEFTLGLVEKEHNTLREINVALAKIMDGTYGICEGTGKPISKVRLEAQPWARYSIEHARKMEKGFIR